MFSFGKRKIKAFVGGLFAFLNKSFVQTFLKVRCAAAPNFNLMGASPGRAAGGKTVLDFSGTEQLQFVRGSKKVFLQTFTKY